MVRIAVLLTAWLLPLHAHAASLQGGLQAKFIGGVGPAVDVRLGDRVSLHGSVGTLLLTVDLAAGIGVQAVRSLDAFLRFHELRLPGSFLPGSGGGEGKTISGPEFGLRWRPSRRLWLEGGLLLYREETEREVWEPGLRPMPVKEKEWKALPNVGLILVLFSR